MTESELVDAATSYFSLGLSGLTLYISICSGYLLVAYFVGSTLTRAQIAIISTLYFVVAVVSTYGTFGWMNRAFGYIDALKALEQSGISGAGSSPLGAPILATVMAAGIIACVKFMWDTRAAPATSAAK